MIEKVSGEPLFHKSTQKIPGLYVYIGEGNIDNSKDVVVAGVINADLLRVA